MPEHKPLYLYSLKEAAEWDEKDEWRESYLENCDCARAIERAIDEHYDGQRLNSCAQEIIDRYGFDRVNFVLAATVRQGTHDGRYSENNKKWARRFSVMDKENTWQYHVRSHPGLVNLFVADARRLWDIHLDDRVTALFEFDLDEGWVSVHSSTDDDWQVYSLHDFSVAAYKAFRSDYRNEECRREIFNNSLAGKEMDLSEETDDETENQVIQI